MKLQSLSRGLLLGAALFILLVVAGVTAQGFLHGHTPIGTPWAQLTLTLLAVNLALQGMLAGSKVRQFVWIISSILALAGAVMWLLSSQISS